MSTSKEYKEHVFKELSKIGEILVRPMMGEYLLYFNGKLFGGIYDNKVLIKRTETNKIFDLKEVIPYKGAKPMYWLEDLTNEERNQEIICSTIKGLK